MNRAELLQKARSILFNTEMVRAILNSEKTVTRRVIKPQPPEGELLLGFCMGGISHGCIGFGKYPEIHFMATPPCHPDDILYVRETWCPYDNDHIIDGVKYAYRVDATPDSEEIREAYGYHWHPSIHMPKEAARIFLKVTRLRVERLQDITAKDIVKEGLQPYIHTDGSYHDGSNRTQFMGLWNSTIAKKDIKQYGWEANPWVWVIEFEILEVQG